MQDFGRRAWSPLGSRPHIYLALPELEQRQQAHCAQFRDWWASERADDPRLADEVLPPVPPRYLHVTLAWLDRLTSILEATEWEALVEALETELAGMEPISISVGPVVPSTCALELWVAPEPQLDELAARSRAALRTVFGDDAAPEPDTPWRPHISLGYAAGDFDSETLGSALMRTELPPGRLASLQSVHVHEVFLVDNDTFPDDGGTLRWDEHTARAVPLDPA